MRYFLVCLCVLLCGGFTFAQSAQEFDCEAEPSPEALEYLRRTHAQRLTHLEDHGSRAIHVVKIAIHIIRTDAGGSGISEANVNSRIATANTRYKDANIVLESCGPFNYIDDSDYSTFNKGTDETIRVANDVPGAINIYFANQVLGSSGGSICGYAKFPTAATALSGTNFTVVKNSCNESSFVHELGHCFGLLHTHSTSGGAELVDRGPSGNCATAGDGFCDTNADPNISGDVNVSCEYTGAETDANGVAYDPPTENIMSYSRKTCRTKFSPSQLSSANYSANNDYVLSRCGAGPITCTSYRALFPYRESFEGAGLPTGWAQSSGDDGNWTLKSGGTSSLNTGPSSAQNGSNYYYTESSGNGTGYPNKEFGLVSTCFSTINASNSYISFYYHMYGSDMGSLDVQVSMDEGNTWTSLWSISGDQGNSWKYKFISLTDYLEQSSLRIRFFATTGAGYRSDIAIDNVYLVRTTASSNYAELPYLDGFEGGAFNSYWTTSSTSGVGRVQVTSNNQPGGEYHATMDVSTNGNYSTNRMDLGVACSFKYDIELSFDWKEFSDETHATDGVYLSTNSGSTWTKIYDLTGGTNQYQRVTLNLSDIAATEGLSLNDNTKIRWQQYDNFGITTDGIAIDNILVKDGATDEIDLSVFGPPADESTPLAPALIEGIEFYPNPFTGFMNVRIPDGFGPIVGLSVYDLTGKVVFEAADVAEGQVYELGQDFAPGVYMVRVQAQGTQEVFKAIKTE